MTSTEGKGAGRALRVLVWGLTLVELVGMGVAGWAKFGSPDVWTGLFVGWGYPSWFSYVVGGAEMTCAVLLLVPMVSAYAAGMLIVIMVGAVGTVLIHPGQLGPVVPVVHIVILSVILVMRWKRRWTPGGEQSN